jgi:hypothetical protein
MYKGVIMPKTTKKKETKAAVKPKRARTAKGHFKADDPSTPHVNEAYVQEKKYTLGNYALAAIILVGIIALAYYSQ